MPAWDATLFGGFVLIIEDCPAVIVSWHSLQLFFRFSFLVFLRLPLRGLRPLLLFHFLDVAYYSTSSSGPTHYLSHKVVLIFFFILASLHVTPLDELTITIDHSSHIPSYILETFDLSLLHENNYHFYPFDQKDHLMWRL
jgi:hypothetical protein